MERHERHKIECTFSVSIGYIPAPKDQVPDSKPDLINLSYLVDY